jgi:uridine kinase
MNYILHYGVKGMKWGVRKDRRNNPKIKQGNLNLFGTPGHNALFITGISGSGKSTFATKLAKDLNLELIHLDSYFEKSGVGNNKNFNTFLKQRGITKEQMFENGKLNYKISDKILPAIKEYPNKVIVEGIQILDTTMSDYMRSFLKAEPLIILQTPTNISTKRALTRDNVSESKWREMTERAVEAFEKKSGLEQELNLSIGSYYTDRLLDFKNR